MDIDKTTCWYKPNEQKMIDTVKKYPLRTTPLGRILINLVGSVMYESVVELGCGTGINSEICHNYTGVDLPYIIDRIAKKCYPKEKYISCDLTKEDFTFINFYDLVLMASFIDVMQYPLEILDRVLKYSADYVILHVQDFTDGETYVKKNHYYGGKTYHSVINIDEFWGLLETHKFKIIKEERLYVRGWDTPKSLILKHD